MKSATCDESTRFRAHEFSMYAATVAKRMTNAAHPHTGAGTDERSVARRSLPPYRTMPIAPYPRTSAVTTWLLYRERIGLLITRKIEYERPFASVRRSPVK